MLIFEYILFVYVYFGVHSNDTLGERSLNCGVVYNIQNFAFFGILLIVVLLNNKFFPVHFKCLPLKYKICSLKLFYFQL